MRRSVFLFLIFQLSGCTALGGRVAYESKPMLGTRGNFQTLLWTEKDSDQADKPSIPGRIFAVIDMPLSFVADVLFLPNDLLKPSRPGKNLFELRSNIAAEKPGYYQK